MASRNVRLWNVALDTGVGSRKRVLFLQFAAKEKEKRRTNELDAFSLFGKYMNGEW